VLEAGGQPSIFDLIVYPYKWCRNLPLDPDQPWLRTVADRPAGADRRKGKPKRPLLKGPEGIYDVRVYRAEPKGNRYLPPQDFVFVLEIVGKQLMASEAKSSRKASELCMQSWLRADLAALKPSEVPLCNPTLKRKVRRADTPAEVYPDACREVPAHDDLR
jgi:hypothetical protein